jgi:hypothetical protein
MTTATATYSNTALAADLASDPQSRAPAQQPRKNAPTIARRDASPNLSVRETLPQKTAVYEPGLLERLLGKFVEMRQRSADREIARYLASTGGKMTDSIEREIQRRLM